MKPQILSTWPGYTAAAATRDVFAGVTVAMVAIPLCLAIAIASGAEPIHGLITAIVGGFLISALGGSHVQIGGPTGAFIVVVYDVISQHGMDGLVLATLIAGVILSLAALFRAGSLIAHVPEPVINGFTVGIAVIIATSQLPDFLGIPLNDAPAHFLGKLAAIWQARDQIALPSFAIGLATMAAIVLLRRFFPRFPGLILAVAGASGLAFMSLPDVATIGSRFGALPTEFPWPTLPQITYERIVELLPSALIIAFLAGIESLLSAMVADRMTKNVHRPNAELMSQGVANLACAAFGSLPATGAIARTATNIRAGGTTPVAGMVHTGVILLVFLFAAPLANYLALPALGGLLLLTAWNMSEPHHWSSYVTAGPVSDRGLFVLTLVLTVFTDLTVAIATGVAIGLALRLKRRKVPPQDWTPPDR